MLSSYRRRERRQGTKEERKAHPLCTATLVRYTCATRAQSQVTQCLHFVLRLSVAHESLRERVRCLVLQVSLWWVCCDLSVLGAVRGHSHPPTNLTQPSPKGVTRPCRQNTLAPSSSEPTQSEIPRRVLCTCHVLETSDAPACVVSIAQVPTE